MSEFAKQDIFSGEAHYERFLNLVETVGINNLFEMFGADNMIMLTNSGSYYIIQISLMVQCVVSFAVLKVALCFTKHKLMRAMGMRVQENSERSKLFYES